MRNVTGIDDIGTMTALSEGWSFFSIPESLSSDFIEKSKFILAKSKLNSFHGKEFKRKKIEFYKEFLALIKEILTKGEETLLACTILSKSWKDEYNSFCKRLIDQSFSSSNFDLNHLIQVSSKLASPFFTFMRLTENFRVTRSTIIEIDKQTILKNFPGQSIIVGEHRIDDSIPIYAATNAYRKRVFPNSPEISKSNIYVLNDEESFFIQAADLFGNFALSYVFKCLGKESKSNDLKSQIFSDVFEELATPRRIIGSVEICGEDLLLKNEGAFTVHLSTV